MEIQFQQQEQQGKMSKFKGRNNKKNSNKKFVGVRQRPSGRWVAEIKDTTQKIRMWLGTFETAEAAARAYDEAACLLRGSNTRTNFVTQVSANSPLASRIQNLLDSKKSSGKKQCLEKKQGLVEKQSPDFVSSTSITTSSTITIPTISGGDFSSSGKVNNHTQLFDDAYKPDLSNCKNEFDMGTSYQSIMSWGFGSNAIDRFQFGLEMLEVPKNVGTEMEFLDFERMKVERQISASLYAMNGVHEYMETVHDPSEAIWDLPPLTSLFC